MSLADDDHLRQIEALIAELEQNSDHGARRLARDLLEVVLDLHGLALARIAAAVAEQPGALGRLAGDAHVRAVLLLHGLHPEEPAERVARAVAELNRDLANEGVRVNVVSVSNRMAHLAARPGRCAPEDLRRRIEHDIVEAAPELEELRIEGLEPALRAALAG